MSRVRTAQAVLTVLVAVLLSTQLLVHGAAASPVQTAEPVGVQAQGSCQHKPGSEDAAGHLRKRTRTSVGNVCEPEPSPWPLSVVVVPTLGADPLRALRDSYRMPVRHLDRTPPRDTSPAALQVFRC
jgi:hypothetical protein